MADRGTHTPSPSERGSVPVDDDPTLDAAAASVPANDDQSLDAAAVRRRLASVSYDSYLMLYSLMKSVSVAAAAFAVAKFAAAGEPGWWPEITFWTASFSGLVLTYHAALVGSVIHELRLSIWDSALPLLLCAVETLLFFVLTDEAASSQLPTAWYPTFACWAGLATTIIWRVRTEIDKQAQTAAGQLKEASEAYVKRLTVDRRVAGLLASAAALLWLMKASGALDGLNEWEGVIGVVLLGALLVGLDNQRQALNRIRTSVALPASTRPSPTSSSTSRSSAPARQDAEETGDT